MAPNPSFGFYPRAVAALFIVYTCGLYTCGAQNAEVAAFRAPYVPADEKTVLQDVPAGTSPAVRRMHSLKDSFVKQPEDLAAAVQLSDAYIDYGRQIGDAHYAGYAEAVISPWLGTEAPAAALVVHGVILQYQHQFDSARQELRRAIQREPGNAQAWLTLSSIDMIQGDYDAARADCQHLIGRENLTIGIACLATVRSFVGQARSALQLLNSISANSAAISAGPLSAWIAGLKAEVAGRLGESGQEEAFYREALRDAPEDDFLLVSYADFLLDQNRAKEVLALLANQTQSDTAFLRIALAHQVLGGADVSRYTWIMSARFEALNLRGSALYDREHARFVLHMLHDADGALGLARGNWRQQKAPWDVRVYLEAALAAGKPEAAAPALAFIDTTHLQDPVLETLAKKFPARGATGKLQ